MRFGLKINMPILADDYCIAAFKNRIDDGKGKV